MAVGQDDDSATGIWMPAHEQNEARQAATVRHNGAAAQIHRYEQAEAVTADAEMQPTVGVRGDRRRLDHVDSLQLSPRASAERPGVPRIRCPECRAQPSHT